MGQFIVLRLLRYSIGRCQPYIAWCVAGRSSFTKGADSTLKQGVQLPDQIKGWAEINVNQPHKADLRGCAGG